MRIKDIEQHQPILKLLAAEKQPFNAEVERITKSTITFKIDKTIQMMVDIDVRDNAIKAGHIVSINVETGEITLAEGQIPAKAPVRKNSSLGCDDPNAVKNSIGTY